MKRKIFRILKRTLITIGVIVVLLTITTLLYIRQEKFGKSPEGKRLEAMKQSAHFKDGQFQNIHNTPELTEGHSTLGVMFDFMFKKTIRRKPIDSIPSVKTDLLHLPANEDVLIWFGHSSCFIQIDGKRILIDPVFSGNASPVPGTNKSFKGTDIYTAADIPDIDYLFISHDHYDHLDYETLLQLRSRIKMVFCGLGVGAHFERWGYAKNQIREKDWGDKTDLGNGFVVYTTPARHFSGRSFSKNNTLWVSYVLQTPSLKIYIGGDSGYDTHFADIGKQYGPIDLAMIDNGQYDSAWRYIHTLPEQVLQAAKDLHAKRLFPVHSSKFAMANHPWDEPLIRITELNKVAGVPLVTPCIGEPVYLKDTLQTFKQWWTGVN